MSKPSVKSVQQLQDLARALAKVQFTALVATAREIKEVKITSYTNGKFNCAYILDPGFDRYEHTPGDTLSEVLEQLPELVPNARVFLESVKVLNFDEKDGLFSPLSKDNKIYKAGREAFGELLEPAEIKYDNMDADAARGRILRDFLLRFLLAGEKELWRFEKVRQQTKELAEWTDSDLSGAFLEGVVLFRLDFSSCNFDGAKLKGASLIQSKFRNATFRGADLTEANLSNAEAKGANFENAVLKGARLHDFNLRDATLTGADLSKAQLYHASLSNVDLSTCKIDKTEFSSASYDEKTKFPANFAQTVQLNWRGKGPDPFKATMKTITVPDFDSFMHYLKSNYDENRIKNVIKMLKKDSFQLYADVTKSGVTGVVKSQRDPDLFYACSLQSDGNFCCGTQNLRACGGLKGALCKHLLVLLIGLTKAGQIDHSICLRWVLESLQEYPEMDKDTVSEIFLKYKAAGAGKIDWRPMETIPEDYYAF